MRASPLTAQMGKEVAAMRSTRCTSRTDVREVVFDLVTDQLYGAGPNDIVVRISFARKHRRFGEWQVSWSEARSDGQRALDLIDAVLAKKTGAVAA